MNAIGDIVPHSGPVVLDTLPEEALIPVPGIWKGITSQGRSVSFTLSDDGKSVLNFHVSVGVGGSISTEETRTECDIFGNCRTTTTSGGGTFKETISGTIKKMDIRNKSFSGTHIESVQLPFTTGTAKASISGTFPSPTIVEGTFSGVYPKITGTFPQLIPIILMGSGNWVASRPFIAIDEPKNGTLLTTPSVTVSGTAAGPLVASADVNSVPVELTNGSFSTSVDLAEGENSINLTAFDADQKVVGTYTVRVTLDSKPTIIQITEPEDGLVTPDSRITVKGTVDDASILYVDVNEIPVVVVNGEFTTTLSLAEGVNHISAKATDKADNLGSAEVSVTFKRVAREFQLSLQEGINLISVPLDPSGVPDGKPWRLSELIDFIGSDAKMIIRYDKDDKKFVTYMPNFPKTSPANTVVQGGEGYIVVMSEPASVTFMGTTWDGKISLTAGINVISVPLNPSAEEWRLSDLMSFIGKDATIVISYDKVSKKFVNHMPTFPKTSPSNTVVQGGEGYIVMMKAPADVVFTGTAWENTITASPPLMTSTLNRKATPFFVIEGFVSQRETGATLNNVKVAVNNLNNGLSNFSVTGMVADDGRYVVTLADFLQNRAVQVGDVIEVVANESKGAFCEESVRYTIKENDILSGKASLGNLPMLLIPKSNALLQNYPNPFNPETWIPFALAENAEVMIRIYDLKGRLVRKLCLGRLSAGRYMSKRKAAYWDGRNHQGEQVASGVYIYQMVADMKTFTKRMVILK